MSPMSLLGPERPRRDRARDHQERHRAHPERRRNRGAAEHPGPHRGAPARPRPPGPQAHGGGAGRDPQPSARRGGPPQEAREGGRGGHGREPQAHGDAPEDNRPPRRRGRPRRGREGAGGPRGLVARAPLIRPTDAPPRAHESDAPGEQTARPATDTALRAARTDLPAHVAIIMDGNRRWARGRGVSELDGHAAGVEAIREVLRHAVRREISVLTLYAFSRENWARTDEEVVGLFSLL